MNTQAGVGISHHRNPKVAGQEAATQALHAAGIEQPDFVFLYASVGYKQSILLESVRQTTSHAPLCGCSGEGIIVQNEIDESNFSVAVMVIRSDEISFRNGIVCGIKETSEQAGQDIATAIIPHIQENAKALFVFPDGLTCNFDQLQTGIEQTMQPHRSLPLFGGLAADNWDGKQTYQYCNDQVVSDGVAWVLLSGNVQILSNVNHGCLPLGIAHTITRSEENVIYEIDNKPALEVLKEYINDEEIHSWSRTVANLCIGLKAPAQIQQEYDEYLIRFMPTKDDATGSVTIPTNIASGTQIWMTHRDYDKIAKGINKVVEQMQQQLAGTKPKIVFQFDCAGRGKVIFREEQKEELLKILQNGVGNTVPWIGFSTYGEIGPVHTQNCFHNYTVVLVAIC